MWRSRRRASRRRRSWVATTSAPGQPASAASSASSERCRGGWSARPAAGSARGGERARQLRARPLTRRQRRRRAAPPVRAEPERGQRGARAGLVEPGERADTSQASARRLLSASRPWPSSATTAPGATRQTPATGSTAPADAEQRRLAAAVRPRQEHAVAVGDRQVDRADTPVAAPGDDAFERDDELAAALVRGQVQPQPRPLARLVGDLDPLGAGAHLAGPRLHPLGAARDPLAGGLVAVGGPGLKRPMFAAERRRVSAIAASSSARRATACSYSPRARRAGGVALVLVGLPAAG